MTGAGAGAVDPGRDSARQMGQIAAREPVAAFGTRLRTAVQGRGALCVGVDPHPGLLAQWGLGDDVEGLSRFCDTVVEALADRIAVLKPQSAFFERFGSAGVAVLERLIVDARSAGALTIIDAKRGDIGSTMAAYAQAYVGAGSPLAGDAVTVSPYLGFESLRPLLSLAAQTGRGTFVLALTSNPEGPTLQHARTGDGRTVAQTILDAVGAENASAAALGGAAPLGSVGVVVGATVQGLGREHDVSGVNGPILAPGVGAQGATAQDLRAVFGSALGNVLPSSSREVLAGGPSGAGLRDAAARALDSVSAVLSESA
jgi:orotidine-5'-phosphate decarboxylase